MEINKCTEEVKKQINSLRQDYFNKSKNSSSNTINYMKVYCRIYCIQYRRYILLNTFQVHDQLSSLDIV